MHIMGSCSFLGILAACHTEGLRVLGCCFVNNEVAMMWVFMAYMMTASPLSRMVGILTIRELFILLLLRLKEVYIWIQSNFYQARYKYS
jgi:hypothetical protein